MTTWSNTKLAFTGPLLMGLLISACGGGSGGSSEADGELQTPINTDSSTCVEHNPYGTPSSSDQVLCRESYSVGYNYETRQGDWVSYALTKDKVNAFVERTDDFREDTEVPEGARAVLGQYDGYDRGHMAPAATVGYSDVTMSETFLLSNISPQLAELNRFGWATLEDMVRDCVNDVGDLVVITGTLFTITPLSRTDGPNSPAIPDAYYKVLLKRTPPLQAIAFNIPHAGFSVSDLGNFVVSVDALEEVAGQDFFSLLSDADESSMESRPVDFCNMAPGYQPDDEDDGAETPDGDGSGSNSDSDSDSDSGSGSGSGGDFDFGGSGSSYGSCGTKTTCSAMSSCAEAKYFLNSCGVSRLDGDKDGVPCESICG